MVEKGLYAFVCMLCMSWEILFSSSTTGEKRTKWYKKWIYLLQYKKKEIKEKENKVGLGSRY